jgi:adenylate cyclase
MSEEQAAMHPVPEKPSLAVLPFINMSRDPEQEYFSDGMTEDIITALSRIRWFFIIARNSTFAYKDRAVDVRKVAKELGVRYVLEGSVRKAGSRVRVTAQLIDGDTGKHVWANRYDRELDDVFSVQDELTETIVGALDPELGKAERERAKAKRPENLDAWDVYQRGLWHLYHYTKEDIEKAQQLFREATSLDPNLGVAFSGLAEAFYFSLVYGHSDAPEHDREEALVAARTAVELDGEDAVAHCTLGRIYYVRREHDLAIAELQTALELNPSLAWAHYGVGAALVFSGRAREALPFLQSAMKLSPRDPNMGSFLVRMADAHLFMRDYDEAIAWAKKALRQSGFQWSRYAVLVSALGHLGRLEEANRALQELRTRRSDFSIDFVQATHLIADTDDMSHYLEGLRKASVT